MYFVSMLLKLKAVNEAQKLSVANGVQAHGAILAAITRADSEAGRKLHNMERNKVLSLAIVGNTRQSALLRVTFMAEEGISYANTLATELSIHPKIELGEMSYEIETVDLSDPHWAGISTWSDFTNAKNGTSFQFCFVTPTAIAKNGKDLNRFFSLYPDPVDVFTGLARRWSAFSGPSLPEGLAEFIRAGGCVISRHYLRTESLVIKERVQIGFTGRASYKVLDEDTEYVAALNALARFARFSGIGYQTARGMGAVQVLTH